MMEVNANLAQDVFKDAGESVIFLMLSLKREDRDKECEIIADMADRIEAIQRSMNIRVAPETVKLTFGFSNRAWEYLFPGAKKPKELEDFKGVNGKNHQAPTTPVDLFLHVRADEASTTYLVVDQIMGFLRPIVDVVDETHGFHYREGRAIIDFIDGTENRGRGGKGVGDHRRARWSPTCSRRTIACSSIRRHSRDSSSSSRQRSSWGASPRANCSKTENTAVSNLSLEKVRELGPIHSLL